MQLFLLSLSNAWVLVDPKHINIIIEQFLSLCLSNIEKYDLFILIELLGSQTVFGLVWVACIKFSKLCFVDCFLSLTMVLYSVCLLWNGEFDFDGNKLVHILYVKLLEVVNRIFFSDRHNSFWVSCCSEVLFVDYFSINEFRLNIGISRLFFIVNLI